MDKEMKNKLCIMDFDGTLVETPMPDMGRIIYKQKTGNVWPHDGWWGRHESLDMEVFNMETIQDVVDDYNREKAKSNTIMVMLTGRLLKLADYVKNILDAKGFEFDEYCYNRGGSTEIEKMRTMEVLLEKYPDIDEMELWDDRLEHIPIFEEWGKNQCLSGRLKEFSINFVPANRH
jgi:hypothetical protein